MSTGAEAELPAANTSVAQPLSGRQSMRRRSSLGQHFVREGVSLDTKNVQELVRQLPPSLLSNAARHSASTLQDSRRSSLLTDSSNPTPMPFCKRPATSLSSAKKVTSIPRPAKSLSLSRIPNATATRSVGKSTNAASAGAVRSAGKSLSSANARARKDVAPLKTKVVKPLPTPKSGPRRSTSATNLSAVPKRSIFASATKLKMTRAASTESLNWNMRTPVANSTMKFQNESLFTNNNNTSTSSQAGQGQMPIFCDNTPSSLKLIYGDEEPPPILKTIKVPTPSEKKALCALSLLTLENLQAWSYPKTMTVDDLCKVTALTYIDICRFMLEQLGFSEFSGKMDDIAQELIDISVALKYPALLTKSMVKSPNNPTYWPGSVTFLAWLSMRVKCALVPRLPVEPHSVTTLTKKPEEIVPTLVAKCITRMFFKTVGEGDVNLEDELRAFRQGAMDVYAIDDFPPCEILRPRRAEMKAEYDLVFARIDPTAEIEEGITSCKEKMVIAADRKVELEKMLEQYEKVDHLESAIKALEGSMELEQKNKAELEKEIQIQGTSMEKDEELRREIEDLQRQQDTVIAVIESMTLERDRKIQLGANMETTLQEMCRRLGVTTDFNEGLDRLEQLGLVTGMRKLEPNPFSSDGIEPWLKSSVKVLKHASLIIKDLQPLREDVVEEYSKKNEGLVAQIAALEQELSELPEDLDGSLDSVQSVQVTEMDDEDDDTCSVSSKTSLTETDPETDVDNNEQEDEILKEKEEWKSILDMRQAQYDVVREEAVYLEEKQAKLLKRVRLFRNAAVDAKKNIDRITQKTSIRVMKFLLKMFDEMNEVSKSLYQLDMMEDLLLECEEREKEAEEIAAEEEERRAAILADLRANAEARLAAEAEWREFEAARRAELGLDPEIPIEEAYVQDVNGNEGGEYEEGHEEQISHVQWHHYEDDAFDESDDEDMILGDSDSEYNYNSENDSEVEIEIVD